MHARFSLRLLQFNLVIFAGAVAGGCAQYVAMPRYPGAVMIELKRAASPEETARLEAALAAEGLRVESELLDGTLLRMQGNPHSFGREEEIAKALLATGAAEFAEPDFIVPLARVPNDFGFGKQWHHQKLHSELAWSYSIGNIAIKAAICDSGFEITHPDLAGNLSLPGYNVFTGGTELAGNPHGTETSGTIAARGNNGLGVAGVAWNLSLIPVKVSDNVEGSSSFAALSACLQYAANRGARVINLSYGSVYASDAVDRAAAYARARGAVVVIAGGNETTDISNYRNSPNYLMVGGTDRNDGRAWFSNWGTPIDLAAPGTDIYTTAVGGGYGAVSGTSFSAPIVAGVAALIISLNPAFTPSQVEGFLMSTSHRVGLGLGAGVVDAGAAVAAARAYVQHDRTKPASLASGSNSQPMDPTFSHGL